MALGSSILPETVRSSGLAVLTTGTAVARFGASVLFGMIWTQFGLTPAVTTFMIGLTGALGITLAILPPRGTRV